MNSDHLGLTNRVKIIGPRNPNKEVQLTSPSDRFITNANIAVAQNPNTPIFFQFQVAIARARFTNVSIANR